MSCSVCWGEDLRRGASFRAGFLPEVAMRYVRTIRLQLGIATLAFAAAAAMGWGQGTTLAAPVPLLAKGHPVDWLFVFKFNAKSFPGCGATAVRSCLFGGDVQKYSEGFSQQFVYASNENETLQQGNGCVGDSVADPLGATFDEIYNGNYYYVVWNDQFYDDPKVNGCSPKGCGGPWGHSKGVLAWNDAGEGMVLQVSTPTWPASGGSANPRKTDGNTLGCTKDNDVEVSQHFLALKLSADDVVKVLTALGNASVVTDPKNSQVVKNGGPAGVVSLVNGLGTLSKSTALIDATLASGVELISKPSRLNVPPWQMVSSVLGGVPLRTANWWEDPAIYSTTATTVVSCWPSSMKLPGAVEIATSGQWAGTKFGLTGGLGDDKNHAKLGVSTAGPIPYTIFGDMNQQGTLSGADCSSSQNGRGGTFYVMREPELATSLTALLTGDSAPTEAPPAGAPAVKAAAKAKAMDGAPVPFPDEVTTALSALR